MHTLVRTYTLAILPTAGVSNGEPSEAGKCRVEETIRLARNGCVLGIAILGGKGEAIVYEQYIRYHYQKESWLISIVDSQKTCCTNRDLVEAMPKIRQYLARQGTPVKDASVVVTTYSKHFERIGLVLKHLGFTCYVLQPSGEKRVYPDWVDSLLLWVTKRDPEWRCLGWPLVWWTSLRS